MLKNGKMTFKNSQKAQNTKQCFDQSEYSFVNRNGRKGINVHKSFVDGSWPTYVIHVFLQNKLIL